MASSPITRSSRKRATSPGTANDASPSPKKRKPATPKAKASPAKDPVVPKLTGPLVEKPLTVDSPLSFDIQAAKEAIIKTDERWRDIMSKITCKPFEVDIAEESGQSLAHVNPFRSLCTSIIGQQVSWLAARAINHKFQRLFFPDMSEKYEAGVTTPFPDPAAVLAMSHAELRTAGLSGRKVEYVQEIAAHFGDGRLSAEKLIAMSDEEIYKELTAIRGIGRWTVDMFLIFTMRRPDIISPGDLGLQKGLVRWYTMESPAVQPKKLKTPNTPSTPGTALKREQAEPIVSPSVPHDTEDLPDTRLRQVTPPAQTLAEDGAVSDLLPPFPESETLTREKLKGRLAKKVKGAYVTATEMEELSAIWKPYRSVAMYYLWSLTDGADSGS